MARVTFLKNRLQPTDVTLEVSEGESLQRVALDRGVPIGDACGGNLACSTCHCYVLEGLKGLSEMDDREDTILGRALDVKINSRLGCQARVSDVQARYVVQVSEEGLDAYIHEHGDPRPKQP